MQVFRGIPARADVPIALTIGNFDGVHLGHRAMISRLTEVARRHGLPVAVMTFEPQPQEFFAPDQAPARLTSLHEKLEILRDCGVARVYVCRFDYAFAQLTAAEFVSRILHDGLAVRWLLVGDDFRFGARRSGDFALLKSMASQSGFEVEAMTSVVAVDGRVSSTAIRGRLEKGDLSGAQQLLGRPYSITGRVVGGDKLGAKIGYPTANVQLKRSKAPLSGIFIVEVDGLGPEPVPGVASLGVRPTVKEHGRPTLEVHLFDFDASLYGRRIDVRFLKKLRDEQKFAGIDALVAQMDRDAEQARHFFAATRRTKQI
ncbi:MAG TPA: bifunctional riboflavin kinase/FAD synthetase [Burkholderiales bacterium]|nr:bifunctional riboflavin kinase/FAD synthetase [Burkholderiales bacterium]